MYREVVSQRPSVRRLSMRRNFLMLVSKRPGGCLATFWMEELMPPRNRRAGLLLSFA